MSSCRRPAALLLAAGLLAATPAGAATWRWTGLDLSSPAWSRPQNWDLLSAPANDGTATLVFGDIAASARHDPVADVAWEIAGLELASDEPYLISGAALSLRGGISVVNPSTFGAQHRIANAVLLLNDSAWSNASSTSLVMTGSMSLSGHTLGLATVGSGSITLEGDVSGSGAMVKRGDGTLRLAGHNTYSGGTTQLAGQIVAQGPNAIPPGAVTLRTGLFDLGSTGNVLGPGAVALDGLVLGGVQSGSVSVTGNPIRIAGLGDWVVYDADHGMSETLLGGTLDLESPDGSRIFRIGDSFSTTEELTILASIVNPMSVPGSAPALRKLGGGRILLGGINTFARALQIEEGGILVLRAEALGARGPGDPTIVLPGASLELATPFTVADETLILNGPGREGIGALLSQGTSNVWAGPVVLASDAAVGVESATPGLTLAGVVSGPGGLSKVGAGTLSLTGANTYQGATTVAEGVLRAAGTSGEAIPGDVTVAGGGTLAGDGAVGGTIVVQPGGVVDPAAGGAPASSLAADAATFTAGSTLRLALTSNGNGSHLELSGAANLAGRLEIAAVAPYSPLPGQAFTLIRYGSRAGEFTDLALPPLAGGARWVLEYRSGELIARVVLPTAGVRDEPPRTALHAPTPNPFSSRARIRFELARPARARVEILDLRGRVVRVVLDRALEAGPHEAHWTGVAQHDGRAQSGVYFVRLRADGHLAGPPRRLAFVR